MVVEPEATRGFGRSCARDRSAGPSKTAEAQNKEQAINVGRRPFVLGLHEGDVGEWA
jgi:hypothetical protein